MKSRLLALSLLGLIAAPAFAEDLKAPKPEQANCARVLLHLAGSDRLIDYRDVYKIYTCDPQFISFETADGYVVSHHGSYTLIEAKNGSATLRSSVVPGRRFYDPK